MELPSDVTFGGSELGTMYFVSIAVEVAGMQPRAENAGAVMAVEGSGYRGRPEPRFKLRPNHLARDGRRL